MTVTWTTYANVPGSIIQFGKNKENLNKISQSGNVVPFRDNGNRVHYIHRVTLEDLEPNTTYCKFNNFLVILKT